MEEPRGKNSQRRPSGGVPKEAPRRSANARKRRRKKQLTRLLIYALLFVLAILLLLALVSLVRKIRNDRVERTEEQALQVEREQSALFQAEEVLHLSFPVLTLENAEGVPQASGLTVSEFKTILQDLYEQGYVLVDLYSLAEVTETGYRAQTVMVPEGKKPLILSQYGVQYTSANNGRADAMVRTAAGEVLCSYIDEEGKEAVGAVDVVPVLEAFLKENPDFSYKGARGILGVTGSEGLLGYQIRKDENILSQIPIEEVGESSPEALETEKEDAQSEDLTETAEDIEEAGKDLVGEDVSSTEKEKEANGGEVALQGTTESDRILRENRETIQSILGSLRSSGWHIASNGYGGVSYGSVFEIMQEDVDSWKETVGALVGTTDILLLPGKADIGNWSGYDTTDPRYQLLQEQGFRYYCTEDDGALTWIQIRDGYVRQGIHTVDTYEAFTSLNLGEKKGGE